MKPYVAAGIFARGGSKGVPRKNVRPLAGKPLLAYAIEAAQHSSMIDRVFVSTDDREIADCAMQYGAEVPFLRPAALAADDAPEWMAWQHAVRALDGMAGQRRWDALVVVPTTSPLRTVDDIDACIAKLLSGEADIAITVRKAERSPYFNMVTLDERAQARLVIAPERATFRRQDAPAVFDITTVAYAVRPSFVLAATGMFQGRVEAVVVPAERSLDIDTEFDFQMAECLMQRRVARP